jgi:hypothetical protein
VGQPDDEEAVSGRKQQESRHLFPMAGKMAASFAALLAALLRVSGGFRSL